MIKNLKKSKKHKFKHGIKSSIYKSKLEESAAALLEKEFPSLFSYEASTFELRPAFKFCTIEIRKQKIVDKCINRKSEYTPDFTTKDLSVVIEMKGFAQAEFLQRWKHFKEYASKNLTHSKIFIIYSIKDLALAIPLIKQHISK